MQSYLIFRLYGAMCSWGDIAVGEYRPGSSHPTRSGVLGLVAAALGIRRDDYERMTSLFESVRYAVRIDRAGVLITDYHTSQVSGTGRHTRVYESRRDELSAVPKNELNTILSKRDYLCDAVFTIVLWREGETGIWTLDDIAEKLRRPVFALYLGRKSCPPSLPLAPDVITAETLHDAFVQHSFADETDSPEGRAMSELLHGLNTRDAKRQVYFEQTPHAGMQEHHRFTRRDDPGSRTRRQFAARQELHSTLTTIAQKEE